LLMTAINTWVDAIACGNVIDTPTRVPEVVWKCPLSAGLTNDSIVGVGKTGFRTNATCKLRAVVVKDSGGVHPFAVLTVNCPGDVFTYDGGAFVLQPFSMSTVIPLDDSMKTVFHATGNRFMTLRNTATKEVDTTIHVTPYGRLCLGVATSMPVESGDDIEKEVRALVIDWNGRLPERVCANLSVTVQQLEARKVDLNRLRDLASGGLLGTLRLVGVGTELPDTAEIKHRIDNTNAWILRISNALQKRTGDATYGRIGGMGMVTTAAAVATTVATVKVLGGSVLLTGTAGILLAAGVGVAVGAFAGVVAWRSLRNMAQRRAKVLSAQMTGDTSRTSDAAKQPNSGEGEEGDSVQIIAAVATRTPKHGKKRTQGVVTAPGLGLEPESASSSSSVEIAMDTATSGKLNGEKGKRRRTRFTGDLLPEINDELSGLPSSMQGVVSRLLKRDSVLSVGDARTIVEALQTAVGKPVGTNLHFLAPITTLAEVGDVKLTNTAGSVNEGDIYFIPVGTMSLWQLVVAINLKDGQRCYCLDFRTARQLSNTAQALIQHIRDRCVFLVSIISLPVQCFVGIELAIMIVYVLVQIPAITECV
jgi:hypothetical protein